MRRRAGRGARQLRVGLAVLGLACLAAWGRRRLAGGGPPRGDIACRRHDGAERASPAAGSVTGQATARVVAPAPASLRYSQITQTALSWPFIIAGPAGIYARHGLDVDTSIGGTTANTAQALVAGAADVAQLNVVSHIIAVQKGADIAVVAG